MREAAVTEARTVTVTGPAATATLSNDAPLVLIAGPCQIESRDHAMGVAAALKEAADAAGVALIFKASFDKANRSSLGGPRGVGMAEGLAILADIRAALGTPVLTDIHDAAQAAPAAEAVDVLQIPAFLCRQTDLLLAAAATGRAVNVKKGQFLAPWDMANVAAKVASTGNERLLLTERGVSFGYNTLVTDMRALPEMMKTGYPVVMDATHSVQQPGGQGFALGRATLAPEETAGNAAGRIGALLIIHPQRQKIPAFLGFLGGDHGDQHHGVGHVDQNRAAGLPGDLAGFQGDGVLAVLKGFLDGGHECILCEKPRECLTGAGRGG